MPGLTLEQITAAWMESRREDIIERQRSLNMRASGRTAKSLEVEEKPGRVNLLGSGAFEYQEYGRGPTKKKGRIPLHVIIRQWMKDKGLVEKGGFNAYAIANKIHATGTRIHRRQAEPLGITAIIDNALPALENELGLSVSNQVASAILKPFNRIK